MPNEVFKTTPKVFISNIKDTVDVTLATNDDQQHKAHNFSSIKDTADVTLATDDDKQVKAHNKSFTNQ